MIDALFFKNIIYAKNEIGVEMMIASRSVYGGTKSPVSVSDEKVQANQDCVYF